MFQYYRFITKTGRILACCSLFLLSDLAHASPWSIYLGGGGLTIRPEDSRRTALGQDRFYYFLDRMERMNTSPGDRTLNYLILGSTDLSPPPIQPGSGSLQIRYSETGDPWMFRIGYRGVRGQIPCRECSELNGFPRWHILDQFQQGNRDATFFLYASEFARSQGGFRVSMDLLEFGWTYHFRKNAGLDPYLGLMGRIGTCRLGAVRLRLLPGRVCGSACRIAVQNIQQDFSGTGSGIQRRPTHRSGPGLVSGSEPGAELDALNAGVRGRAERCPLMGGVG